MSHLEVSILGNSYRLACPPGGEARLQAAVARVDAAMCQIRDAGKVRARDRIAVLAALNLAFEPLAAASPTTATHPVPGTHAPEDQQALHALLQRLDQALAADPRLL